jgi:hypothetical protein
LSVEFAWDAVITFPESEGRPLLGFAPVVFPAVFAFAVDSFAGPSMKLKADS